MSDDMEGARDFVRVVAAWFLPPLGVFLQVGLAGAFWLNLLLTVFLWLPGVLHALWVIASTGPHGRENPDATAAFVRLVLAGVLPPVAVLMKQGLGLAFLVNCVLAFFFWIPAIVHAVWVVTQPDPR